MGIVPAYLMGLNIKNLEKYLKNIFEKKKKFLKESAILLSNILLKKK